MFSLCGVCVRVVWCLWVSVFLVFVCVVFCVCVLVLVDVVFLSGLVSCSVGV